MDNETNELVRVALQPGSREPSPAVSAFGFDPSRDAHYESLLAKIRSVFAAAYGHRVMQGYTIANMAERVGWTERTMRRLMLAPKGLTLSHIGVICWALDVEPEFCLEPRPALGIAAGTGETQGSSTA